MASRTITQKYKPGRTVKVKALSTNWNALIAKNKAKAKKPSQNYASPAATNTPLQDFLSTTSVYTPNNTLFSPIANLQRMTYGTGQTNMILSGGSKSYQPSTITKRPIGTTITTGTTTIPISKLKAPKSKLATWWDYLKSPAPKDFFDYNVPTLPMPESTGSSLFSGVGDFIGEQADKTRNMITIALIVVGVLGIAYLFKK